MRPILILYLCTVFFSGCASMDTRDNILRSQELFQKGNLNHFKAQALLPLVEDFTILEVPSFRLIIIPRRTFKCNGKVSIGCYGRYMLLGESSPVEHNITVTGGMIDGLIYTNPSALGHEIEHLIETVTSDLVNPHGRYEKSFALER